MEKHFTIDLLHVHIYDSRNEMAQQAALLAAKEIKSMLRTKPELNIIFAAAPSQDEFLQALVRQPEISWERINAFHMDEYVGLLADAPQSFGNYLSERIFTKVPFKTVNLINGRQTDNNEECVRYALLLKQFPPDIVCMGIGENGHIAFNDPHVAFFDDPEAIKTVELDLVSRTQQVHDGCFSKLELVPRQALTLTIPTLIRARRIFCIVPALTKAKAVFHTLTKETDRQYPSTILRTHQAADLFLDAESSSLITGLFDN